jgi:hypothetical protein
MKGKLKVAPYVFGDSRKIKPKKVFEGFNLINQKVEECSKDSTSLIYTFSVEGEPIAVIGASRIFEGVYEIWSVLSEKVRDHKFSFLKKVLSLLDFGHFNLGIYRYQMNVREGHPDVLKWAAALKMKCEGLMEKFGPDKANYFMFARVY